MRMKQLFRMASLLLAFLLFFGCLPAFAEQAAFVQAREALQGLGFTISDDTLTAAQEHYRVYREFISHTGLSIPAAEEDQEQIVYTILMAEGMGLYDYDALTWKPTSNQIYAFDAEFFNIVGMYTEFLQGVQSIVPDAAFGSVRENLREMTDHFEGHRSVSFTCNGHPYEVRLASYGDWLNEEIIPFINQVLEKEGCSGRLHYATPMMDQLVFVIYGTESEANALWQLMGVSSPEPAPAAEPDTLLNWLTDLLGI